MNRITVIGRLVREPELKEIGDNRIVMNNTVAIGRTFKSENGPDVDFLNFVAWGKRAELIEEFCDKGDLIGLDGRIQSRTYESDKQGTVYITEMVVESVHFLQSRRKRYKRSTKESIPTHNDGENTGHSNNDNQGNNQEAVSGDELNVNNIETANS